MANADLVGKWLCSYKRVTFILCAGNFVVALYILQLVVGPLYFQTSNTTNSSLHGLSQQEVIFKKEELKRVEESNDLRRAVLPVRLMERIKEIEAETDLEISKSQSASAARQKVALELAQRLRYLKLTNSRSNQQESKLMKQTSGQLGSTGLEEWRKKILDSVEKKEQAKLKEDQANDDDNIPGKTVPEACHAEAHTDYDGVAVQWGLTHHVESAADCCQACLDQARDANKDERKCNVWVYCPDEAGCFSPDKFKHEHKECWLKQADQPQLNFKGTYDDEFRQQHSTAPLLVSWVSGVTNA